MRTAKEMFEELGYKLLKTNNEYIPRKSWNYHENHITYYRSSFEKVIKFIPNMKFYMTIEFGCNDDMDREHTLNIKLHQAIHQQMKELGWL